MSNGKMFGEGCWRLKEFRREGAEWRKAAFRLNLVETMVGLGVEKGMYMRDTAELTGRQTKKYRPQLLH
jgi:hypothetical protein